MARLPDPIPEVISGSSKAGRLMPEQPIVHNPAGETGQQMGPDPRHPTGDHADGYAGMPRRENPC